MHQKNILMVLNSLIIVPILIFLAFSVNLSFADILDNVRCVASPGNRYYCSSYSQNFTQNNQTKQTDNEQLIWQKLIEKGIKCSGIPGEVLLAVILQESGGNPYAVNINGIGGFQPKTPQDALKIIYKYGKANVDIGLMQVNYKTWAKTFNVLPKDLLNPEINICIGAKILRAYLDEHNWTWRGIGRYNATTSWKQANYAIKVANHLKRIKKWQSLQQ